MMISIILLLSMVMVPFQGHPNYEIIPATNDLPTLFEHLPEQYQSTKKKYPLILFLHGLGERDMGQPGDVENVLRWGPPRIISSNGTDYASIRKYNFIVMAPQIKAPHDRWDPALVDKVLNYVLSNFRVDTTRIYLTGLSMGGNGVWEYAYSKFNSPNKLAAISPMASWGNKDKGCLVVQRKIPVWAFHGSHDPVVNINSGKSMFESMRNCNEILDPGDYRFSVIDAGHAAWPKVYSSVTDSLSLYDWFMRYSLLDDKDHSSEQSSSTSTWTPPPSEDLNISLVARLPEELKESSGLISINDNTFLSHNDSGGKPSVYKINASGKLINQTHITAGVNIDWEDIAKDNKGNIYVGDIGNNGNNRRDQTIYKMAYADLNGDVISAKRIFFDYDNQKEFPPGSDKLNFDAEAFIHRNDSLLIFTKNRTDPFTGYTYIYRLPDTPGKHVAKLVDSLKLGEGLMTDYWVTGADISPDGSLIALIGYEKLWILKCLKGKNLSKSTIIEFKLNGFTQKEAITFVDNRTLYLTDERIRNVLGGNLYTIQLPEHVLNPCE